MRIQWEHSREHRRWGAQRGEHRDQSTSGVPREHRREQHGLSLVREVCREDVKGGRQSTGDTIRATRARGPRRPPCLSSPARIIPAPRVTEPQRPPKPGPPGTVPTWHRRRTVSGSSHLLSQTRRLWLSCLLPPWGPLAFLEKGCLPALPAAVKGRADILSQSAVRGEQMPRS